MNNAKTPRTGKRSQYQAMYLTTTKQNTVSLRQALERKHCKY